VQLQIADAPFSAGEFSEKQKFISVPRNELAFRRSSSKFYLCTDTPKENASLVTDHVQNSTVDIQERRPRFPLQTGRLAIQQQQQQQQQQRGVGRGFGPTFGDRVARWIFKA